ncbi:MAG: hypothetical protein IJP17_06275 [Clostridia bacterium]|nr:hypothetical protein [Clostridia bacterium]
MAGKNNRNSKDLHEEETLYLADVLDDVDDLLSQSQEEEAVDESPLLLKLINGATLFLAVMLIGASAAFWWVVAGTAINSPDHLSDPSRMITLLILCACIPLIISIIQLPLGRRISIENWLKCMCVSGMLVTFIVMVTDAARGSNPYAAPFGSAMTEAAMLLCCGISGCAMPAMLYYGVRYAAAKLHLPRFTGGLLRRYDLTLEEDSAEWYAVSRDVLALTNFDRVLDRNNG